MKKGPARPDDFPPRQARCRTCRRLTTNTMHFVSELGLATPHGAPSDGRGREHGGPTGA